MLEKLVLKGTPKEIGKQHGEYGKEQVMKSLETYEQLFYGYQKISWIQAKEKALQHIAAIEKLDAHLIEEMEGVAEGAGVDFEDILTLNARSEIALGNYNGKSFSDGCTAIAVTAPLIHDTIIAQNWDWKARQLNSLLLVEIYQKNKPVITMVTEGGMIGKIGMNSSGMGVCFNALLTNKKTNSIPIHLGLRSVLNSHTLSEAISKLNNGNIAAAANFLIGNDNGNGSGMAVNLEVSPFGIDVVGETDGKLVHTNHIISETLKKSLEDRNEFIFEDSLLRKKRAQQLIQTSIRNGISINEETVKEWLSDQFNAPNSINHYENYMTPEHRRMETVFSIIMNLSKRQMYFCHGKPAESEYKKIQQDE
ncbi:C45 family peptidase [Alteribacillus sp. YIM 98480]|uniref:C45 family autoproteolytic acyltransferase/hydolase n=1 Tax=Alteribacillus sp. YIM 98480 TaxID=2606599 RepID=UPI00131DAA59|nr:C45 family peptidase [Alteribacillus sp. YIM 98480]